MYSFAKEKRMKKKAAALLMALLLLLGCGVQGALALDAAADPLKPKDVVSQDGNITLHKQAERIGPDEWAVTVSADVKQMEVEPPKLEVVFVLDVSSTMNACADMEAHNSGSFLHTCTSTCPDDCDAVYHVHGAGKASPNCSCYKSGGSQGTVYYEKRIDVARRAINSLVSHLPSGTDIKYTYFSTNADTIGSYDSLSVYAITGETYIMKGVDLGLSQFSNNDNTKILVLVTDGQATDNLYSSTAFEGFDGMVFTVGFNHVDANLAAMAKNGGSYYTAANPGDLTAAFNAIEHKITAMLVDPMGPKVNFDITGTTPSNGNLSTSGDTIYWTPDENQSLTGKVVEYIYTVKLNKNADHTVGTHTDIALNNPTSFRYGVEAGGETEMFSLNFPIPHAEYAYSSVQVRWVDQDGNALTVDGFTPTEEETVISDFTSDSYTPSYTTDYTTITRRIEVPGGNGAYYLYVDTNVTADGTELAGVEDIDPENAVRHMVTHNYVLVEPGEVALVGEKQMAGRTFREGDTFEFVLAVDEKTDANHNDLAPLPQGGENGELRLSLTPDAGKSSEAVNFGTLSFTEAGTFEYTISEAPLSGDAKGVETDKTLYALTVKVTENADKTLKVEHIITNKETGETADKILFVNTYAPTGSTRFSGKKTLEGKQLEAGRFSFELKNSDGNTLETVQNAADGSFAFTALEYTLADVDNTYTYTVQEVDGKLGGITYDETIYTITVTVSDNGDGTLKAEMSANAEALDLTNVYNAAGSAQFKGEKILTGRAMKAGEFSFELKDAAGTTLETVQNATDGSFSFTALEYTLADVDNTYTYTVQEVPGNLGGVTYDETIHTVTVKISDNGDGTLKAEMSANA
ncbi:MAG: hypothetical protein IJB69_08895, partial [Clostridia bacterium]|nr:hypothetical protein [Clostridia bacterium]